MSRIKVGIIGTGGISHSHMRGYKCNDNLAEVVAVADIIEDRAKDAAAEWGVSKVFTDYRKILDMPEIDAVSVCTYNQAHRDPTVDALNAGKHVLCEKPMAATLANAVDMTKAARSNDGILMIGFHSRFGAEQIAAKRVMDSGFIGKIYYGEIASSRRRGAGGGSFQTKKTAGGGAIADIGCYGLDTALDLLGHPRPVRVSGTTALEICPKPSSVVDGMPDLAGWDPDVIDVEEFGAAWIRFEGGMTLVFKVSWAIHGNTLGRPFFLGSDAGLALNPLEIYTDMFGSMVDMKEVGLQDTEDRFAVETRSFLEAVRDKKPSPIPPEQVIQNTLIVDAIYRSVEACEEVSVPSWESLVTS